MGEPRLPENVEKALAHFYVAASDFGATPFDAAGDRYEETRGRADAAYVHLRNAIREALTARTPEGQSGGEET